MWKFPDQELPSGCPNILQQIRIALNQGVYWELSVLTCRFDNYFTSVLLVRLGDVSVVLSTEMERGKYVPTACANMDRHMWKYVVLGEIKPTTSSFGGRCCTVRTRLYRCG